MACLSTGRDGLATRKGVRIRLAHCPDRTDYRPDITDPIQVTTASGYRRNLIVLIAEILGQSLGTTRHYSLPTDADKQAAIERPAVDE